MESFHVEFVSHCCRKYFRGFASLWVLGRRPCWEGFDWKVSGTISQLFLPRPISSFVLVFPTRGKFCSHIIDGLEIIFSLFVSPWSPYPLTFQVPISHLFSLKEFELINEKKKEKNKSYQNSGKVSIVSCSVEITPSSSSLTHTETVSETPPSTQSVRKIFLGLTTEDKIQ